MSSEEDVAALIESLENEMTDDLKLDVDHAVNAAEDEVRRKRIRGVIGVAIGVSSIMVAGVLLMLLGGGEAGTIGLWMYAIGIAGLISAGFAVPILLIVYVLRDTAKRRIYKRLKPGRMLHGVCLGLAEKTNMDVTLVRLIFLAFLVVGGGIGFWFYVALDVAMPVHPDDRQYLLRFRVRRWLARRNSHADNHAR
jgi:phage shock protein C